MINNIVFIALLLSAICLVLAIYVLCYAKSLAKQENKDYCRLNERLIYCEEITRGAKKYAAERFEENNKRINANYAETIDILNKHRMRMNMFEDAVPTLKLKKFKTVFRRAQSSYETEDLPF